MSRKSAKAGAIGSFGGAKGSGAKRASRRGRGIRPSLYLVDVSEPVSEMYSSAVVFITTPMVEAGSDTTPIGTGFVVAMPVEVKGEIGAFLYVVTAAHVVRSFNTTCIKIRRTDGSITDLPVKRWAYHSYMDIAATPLGDGTGQFIRRCIPIEQFVGIAQPDIRPAVGDEVFFVGLLGQVDEMASSLKPMARGGIIGALYEERVPIRLPDDTLIHEPGHLIDCQSFGGFSGAPCFVRFVSATGETPNYGLRYPVQSTLLLGMVGGHFDRQTSVTLPEGAGSINVPVAAGVGVVYHAEAIRETLEEDELAQARKAAITRMESSDDDAKLVNTRTPDEDEVEFARFEELTLKLGQASSSHSRQLDHRT